MARNKAGDNKIDIENITDISGEVNIAGGDIYKGFTAEQVSLFIQQITTTFEPKKFDGRSPYKGLDVFEEEDAELFFGRVRVVDDLVSRVRDSRTVFITGPSGSGKSSLVRAGLIHALKQSAIHNSERWLFATMKPGRDALEALASAFSRLKSPALGDYFQQNASKPEILHKCAEAALSERGDQRLVLFIDQFEEVFTQLSADKAGTFIETLAHAATVENGRVIILFAMRSDFVLNCAAFSKLNALLNQQFVQIGAMQPDELVSAIAQPALRVGLRVEPELIAHIIRDMQGEPGVLPLMQFALKDLFDTEQSQGGLIALTLKDYLERGGLHKALERHADSAFQKLDRHEQELAHSIFSSLIEIGRGTQDTRRTALFDELVPTNTRAVDVRVVVRKLADARLVTTDEEDGKNTITLAHEKLIEGWPWLKKLVNENRDVIALQNEIAGDAKEWTDHKHDPSYLYIGARLINANEQLKSKRLVLSETALKFIQAGQAREQRRRSALIGAGSLIIALLVLAVIVFSHQASVNAKQANENATLAQQNAQIADTAQAANTEVIAQQGTAQAASTLAIAQQATALANAEEANKQLNIARSGDLASQSLAVQNKDFSLAVLLGLEAYNTHVTAQTRGILMNNTYTTYQELVRRVPLDTEISYDVHIAFSPDRKILATAKASIITLWDVETVQRTNRSFRAEQVEVNFLQFSPNGKILASGDRGRGKIIFWDVERGQLVGSPLTTITCSPDSLAFSQDEKTIAWGCYKEILIWNLNSGQLLHRWPNEQIGSVSDLFFSPDGKTVTAGGYNSTIATWNVETGEAVTRQANGWAEYPSCCDATFFSPDGKTAVSGGYNSTLVVQNVGNGEITGQSLEGITLTTYSDISFRSDGKMLASLHSSADGSDRSIILWDLTTGQSIGQALSEPDEIHGFAFSADGKELIVITRTNFSFWNVDIWGVGTVRPNIQPLYGQQAPQNTNSDNNVLSLDGKTRASSNQAGIIELRDVESGRLLHQLLNGHTGIVTGVSFCPDGKTLASGGEDGAILLWDIETGQRIGQPLNAHVGKVLSVVFSPDGKTLYSSSEGYLLSWDVDPLSWIEKACYRAGRNFTRTEWTQYFPFEEYRKTCDQWPLALEVTSTPTAVP